MRRSTAFWLLVALTVLTAGAAVLGPRGPEPLADNAPADRFSAGRAIRHLEVLTAAPRPVGSPAHTAARQYLVDQLEALGLAPEIQPAFVSRRGIRSLLAANVTNVAVRIRGREPGRAVLVIGHYDSVPAGPGAGDDGSSVAAMLETLRVLAGGPALRNDLIFLFVDAEEAGILGARAFQDQHPWARDVAVALNFEARGTRGPTIMFETGPRSSRLVRELGRLATPPFAASYSFEVYKLMPNYTDFSVFKRADRPGLNFAFIHGATGYHTAQDSLARLDRRSLQHHGETLLGLARALGDGDLDVLTRGDDAIYFPLPGVFVTYPATWALPMALLLALATLAVLALGFTRRRLRAGRLLLALLAQLAAAGLCGGLAVLGSRLAFPSLTYSFALMLGWASHSLALLGLGLLVVALVALLHRWLEHTLGGAALFGAALVFWLLATLAVSRLAPGASYLFALPLAAALLVAALLWRRENAATDVAPVALVAALGLLAMVVAHLWVPTLALIGVALGPPAAALVGVLVALLLLGLLAPQVALAEGRGFALGTLAAGLLVIVAVRLASGFGPDNRRPDTLVYELDTAAGKARWLSPDSQVDAYTRQLLGDSPARATAPVYLPWPSSVLESPAPVAAGAAGAAGAEVVVRSERVVGKERVVDLRLGWPLPAECVFLLLRPRVEIHALALDDQPLELDTRGPSDALLVSWFAPPAAGADLRVELGGTAALEIEVVTERLGRPELPGLEVPPRPAGFMPGSSWLTDATLVRSLHRFEAATFPTGEEGAPSP